MFKKFFDWIFGGYSELPPVETTHTHSHSHTSSSSLDHSDPEIDEIEDAADLTEDISGELVTVTSRGLSGDEPPRLIEIGEIEEITLLDVGEIEEVRVTDMHTQRYLWCLDNGHGELQEGKRAPAPVDGKLFEEWEFNRDIVRRIIEGLRREGVAFFNVVPETQVGSFLPERVTRANAKAASSSLQAIYVSIHANAAQLPAPGQFANGTGGIETFCFPNSQSGKRLATCFQRHLISEVGWRDRGVKEHPFYVLKNTSMPSVLTENGFYTDEDQTRKLLSNEWRQKIAIAHIKAIMEIERDGI